MLSPKRCLFTENRNCRSSGFDAARRSRRSFQFERPADSIAACHFQQSTGLRWYPQNELVLEEGDILLLQDSNPKHGGPSLTWTISSRHNNRKKVSIGGFGSDRPFVDSRQSCSKSSKRVASMPCQFRRCAAHHQHTTMIQLTTRTELCA
jgi:hypothetical protein